MLLVNPVPVTVTSWLATAVLGLTVIGPEGPGLGICVGVGMATDVGVGTAVAVGTDIGVDVGQGV